MDNGQDIHLFWLDAINNPVVFVEQFAYILALSFRYMAPHLGLVG